MKAKSEAQLNTVGKRLRYLRWCRLYKLDWMAKYTDYPKKRIMAWERGERALETFELRRMAYYLQSPEHDAQTTLAWLLGEHPGPICRPQTDAEWVMARGILPSPERELSRLRKAFGELPKLPAL